MRERETLTAGYVRQIIEYDYETGIFTWRARADMSVQWVGRYAGKSAGCKEVQGYIRININHNAYKAHRLAWLYMTGQWPRDDIDHINCDKSDNRFANLRIATRSQNCANKPAPKTNSTGVKGVSFNQDRKKFIAAIKVGGKQIHLGEFDRKCDAAAKYKSAADEHFGEFARC